MNPHRSRYTVIQFGICTFLLAGLVAGTGCGGAGTEQTPPQPEQTSALVPDSGQLPVEALVEPSPIATTSQNSAQIGAAKSYEPGSSGVTKLSSPTEVCDAFVRSLHERKILAAERLLTLSSRITIHDQGLELDALAGENAQYVIGDAKYATQLKQLAYVDCHVSERGENGEINFVVRWMLKPEAGYGWRVFGMVMNENGRNQMINFENSEHAEVVSDIYVANEAASQPISRQAENKQDEIR